jgi:sugar lactone lactonase YvrE
MDFGAACNNLEGWIVMSISETVCVVPAGDRCGEGPVWSPEEQCLYWTDINRFLIHRYNPAHDCTKSWFFEEPVTALALTDSEGVLAVALASQILLWRARTDERREHGFHVREWPAVRLNDGRPDPRGSFWVGTMRNNVSANGSPAECGGTDGILFRIDPDGAVSEWKRNIGISNTLAWSPDRTQFYFADTLQNAVFAYDYDFQTGVISRERPFFMGFPRGLPDGSVTDSEGYLWNCRYGGGCIVRVAPDGRIDRVIEMPATNMTSCTFGGEEYDILFATSAALDAPPDNRLAGSLFSIRTSVPGLPENRFRVFGSGRAVG